MAVYVKRQGDLAIVHLDQTHRPVKVSSFEDDPIGTYRQTLRVAEVAGNYGNDIIWIEKNLPPQPEDNVKVTDAEIAKTFTLTPSAPKSGLPPGLPPAMNSVTTSMANAIVEAFEALIRDVRAERETATDAAAVGTFLINTFPELEERLIAAKTKQVEKRKFSL